MDTKEVDESFDGAARVRNSQACLECRKAKIKCNGKRKDAQNCSRCALKGLDCSWTQSRRGKKPGTKNLATRAREQSDATQQQSEHGHHHDSAGMHSPGVHRADNIARHVGWEHSGSWRLPYATRIESDTRSIYPYSHDAVIHHSPQSVVTPSSASSNQSSSVPTVISSTGHLNSHSYGRRATKYHDGLLIRETKMPPSSTNPLLCLSEAALGKRCTESESEEEPSDAEAEDVSLGLKRSLSDSATDNADAQAKSAREIAVMLDSSGWTRSCLSQAACERASYFSGASASASWDTRRCDPIDRGIVTMEEAERLFVIFMASVQEQFCLLDPVIHHLGAIRQSSNFLFSVILAIASSTDQNVRQFEQLQALVDSLIVEVLSRNVKSVEVVKGLIVWPMWAHLTPLMAEDRAWLLIGTAARMAKELDLSMRKDVPQEDEIARRLARDRSRTWALAAIMERSFSSFSGQKPNTTLDVEWASLNDWLASPIALDGDTQVVAFLHLRRIEENMRSRIFGQSYYEVGSIESIRVSANVLFGAWLEAWCEHPTLRHHPLTCTIMRIIGMHIQVLINTHAIRESDRRKAICEASNMRVLRICSTASKSAREQCVTLLTNACQLATTALRAHAHSLSRIVSAMLGWSGVHLLKNGPIETRGLVVQLGLMLAGDPQDNRHSRAFPRFYGRFILSLSAELIERDRAEKSRRKRQRLEDSSRASPAHGTASASPISEGRLLSRSNTEMGGPGYEARSLAQTSGSSMSEMALAFETAAATGGSGRSQPSHGRSSSTHQEAISHYPGAPLNSMHSMMTGSPSNYQNPTTPIGGRSVNTAAFDAVTSTWLGTDDLLDQYMQSILPIFNDVEYNSSTHPSAGAGSGAGVGVAMPHLT